MQYTGSQALLEGPVSHLSVTLSQRIATGDSTPSQIGVVAGTLDAEIAVRSSHLAPLYGAQIDLTAHGATNGRDNVIRLASAKGVVSTAGVESADSLQVIVKHRRLNQARLVMPGSDTTVAANLASNDAEDITLDLPINRDTTTLIAGGLHGVLSSIALSTWALPGITFSNVAIGKGGRISLMAEGGINRLWLSALSVPTFVSASAETAVSTVRTGAGQAAVQDLKALVLTDRDSMKPQGITVRAVDVKKAASCVYSNSALDLLGAAQCGITGGPNSQNTQRQTFTTQAADNLGLGKPFLPSKLSRATVVTDTTKPRPESRATVVPAGPIRLAALQLQMAPRDEIGLALPTSEHVDIQIPFKIDLGPTRGNWAIATPEGQAMLEGSLSKLHVSGALTWDPASPTDWSVHIGARQLAFAGQITASHQGQLFGGTPQLAKIAVAFSAESDIEVPARGTPRGSLDADFGAFWLLDPKLPLAEVGKGLTVNRPARLDGDVTLRYALRSGRASVISGRLAIDDVNFVGANDEPAYVGDAKLTKGGAHVGSFRAQFDHGVGAVAIDQISAWGETVASIPKDDGGQDADQVQWSGELAKDEGGKVIPVTIASIRAEAGGQADGAPATPTDPADKLQLTKLVVREADVKVVNARYGAGKGLRVGAKDLRIHVNRWGADLGQELPLKAHVELHMATIQDQSKQWVAQIDVTSFVLDIAGGTPSAPTGTGQLDMAASSIAIPDTGIEIRESCTGKPDFQKVPARTKVAVAALTAPLTLSNGALEADAYLLGAAGVVESTGIYQCNLPIVDFKWLDAQKAYYNYPCPTWSEPFRMCPGWTYITPEIRFTIERRLRITELNVAVLSLASKFQIGAAPGQPTQVRYCGTAGLGAVNFKGGYTIIPQTSIPAVNDALDSIERIVTDPIESLVGTGVGTIATMLGLLVGGQECH
jgi:hypothetical protein